jgi:hypothetical protein
MIEQKEKLISRLKELDKLIPATMIATGHIPNDIEGDLYTTLNPGELRINMGYEPKKYIKARRMLSKWWKYKRHHFNELTGNYYVYLDHRNLKIELALELEMPSEYQDGVSCKLIEVGHRTEVIYGIECK